MTDQRTAPRNPIKFRIKIWHDHIGEEIVVTRDISDTGVYLVTEDIDLPPVGTLIKGQIQDLPVEAPVVTMEIIRIEPLGVALKFVQDGEQQASAH